MDIESRRAQMRDYRKRKHEELKANKIDNCRVLDKVPGGYLNGVNFCMEFPCSQGELHIFRYQGMPCVKVKNAYYYSLSECQAWWRGEEKLPAGTDSNSKN